MEVVVIVLEGVLHGLAHLGRGRKVDDAFDVLFLKKLVEGLAVTDIQFIKPCLRVDRCPESGQQIVRDDDISAGIDECTNSMGADVTRSAQY